MHHLSDELNRKFTNVITLEEDEWEIETDTGWEPLVDIKQTVEYDIWRLDLDNGYYLECADDHIVFTGELEDIFVKNLTVGDMVMTDVGPIGVGSVMSYMVVDNMYDVEVGSKNHRFYSNGILSHNTTVAAGYLLWFAMFTSDSNVLVASRNHDGALDIMQRIHYAYENLPDHIRAGVKTYNKKSIVFDNDSRIAAQTTTANTGRGMALSLIYLDEFAFVEPSIANEFWTALSPTLSTGGKCIITSTPDTDEDQFAELWFTANKMRDEFGNATDTGPNGFRPFFADWKEHPERDAAWEAEQLAELGPDRFAREHRCEFITFEEVLINPAKLAKITPQEPIQRIGQVRWFVKPRGDRVYVVSLDPSMGTGGDNAAIQVFELPSLVQVAEWQHNKTPVEGQIRILRDICKELYSNGEPEIYWSVENNSLGEASLVVIRDTGEENIPGVMLHDPNRKTVGKRKGFTTTHKSKLEACARLKHLIEYDKITIYSKNLISELKVFVARGHSFEARTGWTDDLISATLLFCRMAEFIATWDDKSWAVLNTSVISAHDTDDYEMPLPVMFV